MARSLIVFPLCLAVFPVLALFHSNPGMAPLADLLRPLAVVLAAALLLWGVCALLLRHAATAALVSGWWWLLFFAFGHLHAALSQMTGIPAAFRQDDGPLLWNCLALFVLGAAVIIRARRPLERLAAPLNLVAFVLVLMPLVGLLWNAVTQAAQARRMAAELAVQRREAGGIDRALLPNIYFIVLDGYARADMLRDIFHYDNRPFLNFLARRGFFVASHSRSNYAQTSLSIASTLNMTHLDALAARMGADSKDRTPLHAMIGQNAVVAFLKPYGYRTVVLNAYFSTKIPAADITLQSGKTLRALSEFECALVNLTPLVALPQRKSRHMLNAYDVHREHIRFALDTLPSTTRLDGPLFVYAHLLCPHPPFVFDARGRPVQPHRPFSYGDGSDYWQYGGTRQEYLHHYPQQVAFLNHELRGLLSALQDRSRRPAVIILLSDHGAGASLVWDDLTRTNPRERMANLLAVYLPDGPAPEFHDAMTPINLFPILFNRYFNAGLPLCEERVYFSARHPYDFIDITEESR